MKKILEWMKIPGTIVAAVVAFGLIANAFGFGIRLPGDSLAEIESKNHRQDSIIKTLDDYIDDEGAYFENLNNYIRNKEAEDIRNDSSRKTRTKLIEALVRGECLESTFEKLAQQGLVIQCSELGVRRSAGDVIDQKLEGG